MQRDIDLRRIRFFVEVVRQGGFSQAASVVFTTQSAVSKAIKQLEQELGVPLLNRMGRRSEMTAAGQIVYAKALRMLAVCDDLFAELDSLRGLKSGRLRLGFPRAGAIALYSSMYVSFRSRFPGIIVETVIQDPSPLQAMLRAGEIDLAALVQPIPAEFEWQELQADPLVVLVPHSHALASRESVTVAELATLPVILLDEGLWGNEMVLEAFKEADVKPTIATRNVQIDTVTELVASGLGYAFLPRSQAQLRTHAGVRPVLLDGLKDHWRVAFAWERGAILSHAAQAWLAYAKGQSVTVP